MPHKYQLALAVGNTSKFQDILSSKDGENYARIYCGSEFCQHKLIHDAGRYQKIAEIMPVSFILPAIITKPHIYSISRTIKRLAEIQKDFELVINNFGILEWDLIRKRKFPIVMGRLFCQYLLLGTRVAKNVIKYLDKGKCDYLIKRYNVSRFEISSLPSGFRYILPKAVNISMFFPYIPVTMTRSCVFRPRQDRADERCLRQCGDAPVKLGHPAVQGSFIMIDSGYLLESTATNKVNVTIMPGVNRFVRQIFPD